MPFEKQGNFSFDHANQQDDLYKSMTSAQIKEAFDSRANELKVTLNKLIDQLQSTAPGDSAAHLIKTAPIEGITGTTLYDVLQELRLRINSAVAGTIPDGSITPEKLSFELATDDTKITVTDANSHFTSTLLNGVLDELFTSANSVKTNVSGAIGSPATAIDTGATLAGYINNEKGKLASNIGDGTSASALQFLVDRLLVRLDDLTTAVNSKGVPATSADTLAQLVTKVGQIPIGVNRETGSVAVGANGVLTVTGLPFTPNAIYAYRPGTPGSYYVIFIRTFSATQTIANANGTATLSNSGNSLSSNGFSITSSGIMSNQTISWVAYE